MSKTRVTTSKAAVAMALTVLWSVCAAPPTSAQAPEAEARAWYEDVRTELDGMLEELLEELALAEIPAGQRA